jgi:hypothetical protein
VGNKKGVRSEASITPEIGLFCAGLKSNSTGTANQISLKSARQLRVDFTRSHAQRVEQKHL